MSVHRGVAVALVAALVVVAGCRNDAPETQEAGSGVKFDVGVTSEPCPAAVDQAKGCIYLGSISDLTEGPFKALGVPITESQKSFWKRVNEAGGIGAFEVDVSKYVKDNKYNPQIHNEVYSEIKPDVLGLAQTLGSPTTAAILADLKSSSVIGVPASWTSAWAFEDVILESGTNYCFESMNSVDFAVETLKPKTVAAVHFPGDYGDDAAAGTKIAAEANGLTFTDIPTAPGQENQGAAIQKLVAAKPDLVILTTGPTEAATIVGGAAQNGFKGQFIGTSPTWNPALLKSPAAPALTALYRQSGPWAPYGTDTPGPQGTGRVDRPGDLQGRAERRVHGRLGLVVPAEGRAAEGGRVEGPHPGRAAGRGEVAADGGLRGNAAGRGGPLRRRAERAGVPGQHHLQGRPDGADGREGGEGLLHREDGSGVRVQQALLPIVS